MYLSREIVEKFNKSCFNYTSGFSRIYEKFVDFDESGKIISDREYIRVYIKSLLLSKKATCNVPHDVIESLAATFLPDI
ncbi:MAG: hypothetical protein MJ090_01425 [Clostridia bacterium]|nr:hypothetical protein [Clostridia bacterium]